MSEAMRAILTLILLLVPVSLEAQVYRAKSEEKRCVNGRCQIDQTKFSVVCIGAFNPGKPIFVTAGHALNQNTLNLWVEIEGEWIVASPLVRWDGKGPDMALLGVTTDKPMKCYPLADEPAQVGQELMMEGYRGGGPLHTQHATVKDRQGHQIWMSLYVLPGDSGGAVTDGNGRLVGIISASQARVWRDIFGRQQSEIDRNGMSLVTDLVPVKNMIQSRYGQLPAGFNQPEPESPKPAPEPVPDPQLDALREQNKKLQELLEKLQQSEPPPEPKPEPPPEPKPAPAPEPPGSSVTPPEPKVTPEPGEARDERPGLLQRLPWGLIVTGVASAAGVGIPVWAIYAWRARKAVKTIASLRRAARVRPTAGNAPVESGAENPTRTESVQHIVPAIIRDEVPVPGPHTIETKILHVEDLDYKRAVTWALDQYVMKYPGSEGVVGAIQSLIEQFLSSKGKQ